MTILPTSLKEIAAIISSTYIGNDNHIITGFNEIHRVVLGDVVFVKTLLDIKYLILLLLIKKLNVPQEKH